MTENRVGGIGWGDMGRPPDTLQTMKSLSPALPCLYAAVQLWAAASPLWALGSPSGTQEYGLYGHQGLFQPCQTCNLEPCRDSEQPFREECSADTSSCSTLPLLPVLAFTVFFSVSTQDLFVSVSLEKPSLPGAQWCTGRLAVSQL